MTDIFPTTKVSGFPRWLHLAVLTQNTVAFSAVFKDNLTSCNSHPRGEALGPCIRGLGFLKSKMRVLNLLSIKTLQLLLLWLYNYGLLKFNKSKAFPACTLNANHS